MACPFFVPLRRLDQGDHSGPWLNPPRLPLGEAYHGICQALATEPFEPPESAQRELCNCGYARGRCDRFPAGSQADAVRFSVRRDRRARLEIVYILEKNHSPAEHGVFEYLVGEARMIGLPSHLRLEEQARAFLASYLEQGLVLRAKA